MLLNPALSLAQHPNWSLVEDLLSQGIWPTADEIEQLLDLSCLACGTRRNVFTLDDQYVVKFATSADGQAAIAQEHVISQFLQDKRFDGLAPCSVAGYGWGVYPKAMPINAQEAAQMSGLLWDIYNRAEQWLHMANASPLEHQHWGIRQGRPLLIDYSECRIRTR